MRYSMFGHHISDIVYGANDGIITTFAVVSGSAGAGLSSEIIVILGIANLVADGFSMGASKYLSEKSAQEYRGASLEEKTRSPVADGVATFLAFLVAGSLPILPFFLGVPDELQFQVSVISTGATLFMVGAMRSFFIKKNIFSAGFEMFVVGGVASAIAFLLGWFIKSLVSI